MFHTKKYWSKDLVGMKAKVSTVKGKTGGRVQTVKALPDSGASASLISWDLAKKLNMVVFEKGDARCERCEMQAISSWMLMERV